MRNSPLENHGERIRQQPSPPEVPNAPRNCAAEEREDGARSRTLPSWGGPLNEDDYGALAQSWITREIADAANFRRVNTFDGREVIGQKGKRNCAGILIPYYWPGDPHVYNYRLRRDYPEYRSGKDGKVKETGKYLGPPGSSNRLYVPPCVTQEQLENVAIPIVVLEGEKKALAMGRLALYDTDTLRFVPVAIAGVWSWRGRTGKGGNAKGERVDLKGPIPDLSRIAWKSRKVIVLFDRNVHTEDSVKSARNGLARELVRRGAEVRFVTLPEDCGVNGIDDLLALWGPDRVLELLDESTPGASVEVVAPPQFLYKPEGMFRVAGREQLTQVKLTNFTAVITGTICLDDGVETKKDFEIEVHIHGRVHRCSVSASEFAKLDWVIECIGPAAIIFPNQKEYARTAIQGQSLQAEERRVYAHTGWRKIDGHWAFLHSGGAVGAAGNVPAVSVQLYGALNQYTLSPPATKERAVQAVQASLRLLELGPAPIMFPLLAAVYRAVLGGSDFSLHLAGATGTFKSELAALMQQHFGAEMDSRHLPSSWSSTGNSLEAVAFHAKDALLVVDDFAPHGSHSDMARYHSAADRVFRAAGNHSGRGRLDSSAKLKAIKPPRALVLSTGEDVPRGQSVRGRLLILEITKGSVQSADLTACQQDAAEGLYCQAMGAFLQSLAGDYEEKRALFLEKVAQHRHAARQTATHARTPDIVANLQVAFDIFLEFAKECGAISDEEGIHLADNCGHALYQAAEAQRGHQTNAEPTEVFLAWLRSAVSSGRAHLASSTGGAPEDSAEACGWRRDDSGRWHASGDCVGWVKKDGIYLEPSTTYRLVQLAGRDAGEPLAISLDTLKRRLKEKGLLASVETKRGTLTVRRQLSGSQKNVLHLNWSTVFGDGETDAVEGAIENVGLDVGPWQEMSGHPTTLNQGNQ